MNNEAPGQPGIDPTWCSSAKDIVTTAHGTSQIWATIGYGIVNEVYWPSTGQPQIRDFGFIVASDDGWWEIKRLQDYTISTPAPFVPVPTILHRGPAFTLELVVVTDDIRDVLLVRYRLIAKNPNSVFRIYPLIAPRLGVTGQGNSAQVTKEGLVAFRDNTHLYLCGDRPFARASCGFVGKSDGWQDFNSNGRMTWEFDSANEGNVAIMGELRSREGVLALALASSDEGARTLARSSLAEGFDTICDRVVRHWRTWGEKLKCPDGFSETIANQLLHSATVLKVCEDKLYPGAVVASLSIPWGNTKDDLGGYHLVWARDCVQSGLAMLAAGHFSEARQMAAYLIATQQPDGHWSQNFYPDGRPFWRGIQLDEAAFPVLLCAKLEEVGAAPDLSPCKSMIRRAAGFLVRSGALSPQDRWEENAGISAFSIAVQVAGLVAAADFIDDSGERASALAHADYLNRRIEDWLYVSGTGLARKHAVDGYYIRMATARIFDGEHGQIVVANRNGLQLPEEELVSPDCFYLVRLGLRSAAAQEMVDTTLVIDRELARDTPAGPAYYRYNEDGYGEHDDGSAFDGSGRGRLWPLLTGERGHLAVERGENALMYLEAMTRMTGKCGLLPEQIWDAEPLASRYLVPGKPTGSAMPLLWAHAEYIKLAAAIFLGHPVERLQCVTQRYQCRRPEAATWFWRADQPFQSMPGGVDLVIEDPQPFRIERVSADGALQSTHAAEAAAFGMYEVRFSRASIGTATRLFFHQQFTGPKPPTDFAIGIDPDVAGQPHS